MTKLTGFKRKRVGFRNYLATFQSQNLQTDSYGQRTYTEDSTWVTSVSDWPCELISVSGKETVYGDAVSEVSTHVIVGDKEQAKNVSAIMRVMIDGEEYGIVATRDVSGTNRELRVELKKS